MEQQQQQQKQTLKNPLESLLEKKVQVITTGGRVLVGMLRGIDQTLNCVLQECVERIYSETEGVQRQILGLYVLRGDNVATIGEIDQEIEASINLEKVTAAPIQPMVNSLQQKKQ